MSYTQILDHSDQAVDRLHSKHKGKVNIEALVRLLVDPVQDIETVLWQLWTERLIDTAVGEQLNVLGRVVGQLRDGLSDSDYRRYIRARISANKSKGRWSDLITVARLILDDSDTVLVMSESDYMTVLMEVTGILVSDDLAAILIGFMQDTKSDAVRLLLTYSAQAAADTFTLGSIALAAASLDAPYGIGVTTINVVEDISSWPASGDIKISTGAGKEFVAYSAIIGASQLTVAALTKAHLIGAEVVFTELSTTQGYEDDASPGTGGQFASVVV